MSLDDPFTVEPGQLRLIWHLFDSAGIPRENRKELVASALGLQRPVDPEELSWGQAENLISHLRAREAAIEGGA